MKIGFAQTVALALAQAALAAPASALPFFHMSRPASAPPATARAGGASLTPLRGPAGSPVTVTVPGKKLKRLFARNPAPAAAAPPLVPLKRVSGSGDTLVARTPATLLPGVQVDIVVELSTGEQQLIGSFTVVAPLAVTSFTPTSGPPGAHVTLSGSGFTPDDAVTLGKLALKTVKASADTLEVMVPAGAAAGPFTVRGAGGSASSKQWFEPLPAPPKLESFLPAAGPPGTQVKLVVTADSPDYKVSYGERALAIASRTPTSLTVQVPADAKASAVFTITGRSGKSSAGPFTLLMAGRIVSFTPASGLPGSKVTLHGEHFQAGDEILLGGRKLEIDSLAETQIVVEIPAGAKSGPFTLRRGAVTSASKQSFQLAAAPKLTDFTPAAGPAATRVVLSGSGLGPDAEVSFGGRSLKVLSRTGDSALTIMIPLDAADGPFTVTTSFGSATSTRSFKVEMLSQVTGVSPRSAAPGARVTIHGKGFGDSDAFFLGAQPLVIVDRHEDGYVVELPADAHSGELEWSSHGVHRKSGLKIEVTAPRK